MENDHLNQYWLSQEALWEARRRERKYLCWSNSQPSATLQRVNTEDLTTSRAQNSAEWTPGKAGKAATS
jgi:hypothetical protein